MEHASGHRISCQLKKAPRSLRSLMPAKKGPCIARSGATGAASNPSHHAPHPLPLASPPLALLERVALGRYGSHLADGATWWWHAVAAGSGSWSTCDARCMGWLPVPPPPLVVEARRLHDAHGVLPLSTVDLRFGGRFPEAPVVFSVAAVAWCHRLVSGGGGGQGGRWWVIRGWIWRSAHRCDIL
jgi:hypothetical protein